MKLERERLLAKSLIGAEIRADRLKEPHLYCEIKGLVESRRAFTWQFGLSDKRAKQNVANTPTTSAAGTAHSNISWHIASSILPSNDQLSPLQLVFGLGKKWQFPSCRSWGFGAAMEHKGVQFAVVQTTNPCCWKWTAFLDAISSLTGIALTRADAVLDAELAIEKALERQETFKESTCDPDLVPRRSAPAWTIRRPTD
jgi:hypothetical protein